MVTAISLILGTLGAIGGAFYFRDWIRVLLSSIARRYSLHRSSASDYYFRHLDVACRVVSTTEYDTVRTGEIVSRQNKLEGFHVGSGPTAKAITEFESLDGFKLTETEDAGPWRTRKSYYVRFNNELRKRQSMTFRLRVRAKAREGHTLDPHYLWVNEHRQDNLTIRVVFVESLPKVVEFRVLDHEGRIHTSEKLEVDLTNREARKNIRGAIPSRIYSIHWEYDN